MRLVYLAAAALIAVGGFAALGAGLAVAEDHGEVRSDLDNGGEV